MSALWERFGRALEPLARAGRLGCVLLQFPPWFTATRGNARYIEDCRARLGDHRMAVELRHASWGERERLAWLAALLREIDASYVIVDEPQGKRNSMPPGRPRRRSAARCHLAFTAAAPGHGVCGRA